MSDEWPPAGDRGRGGAIPGGRRLLWSVRRELEAALLPELATPAAREAAGRIDAVLAELIVREERTPRLLADQLDRGSKLVGAGIRLVEEDRALADEAARIPRDLTADHGLAALWQARNSMAALLERLVARVAAREDAAAIAFQDEAAAWDRDFIERQFAPPAPQDLPPAATLPAIAPEALEACIAEAGLFPGTSRVVAVETVAGGYSKGTFGFDVDNSELGRFRLALRRNQGDPIDPSGCFFQANEFAVTRALHRAGVRLPEPLHFEPAGARFGGDVTIMRFAPGRLFGDVLNAGADLSADMVRDLATVLAHLHGIDPGQLGPEIDRLVSPAVTTIAQANAAMLDHHEGYWRRYRSTPSPLVARAFAWLRRNLPPNAAAARIVHGDFGLNNVLFDEGRVSAVLDWETLQIGDPAYELAYLRDPLTTRSLWEPFVDAYRAAGGQPFDAASIRFHRAARWLRNAAFSNVSAGRFESGMWDSLAVAALAVAVRPVFLRRADDFARDTA